MNKNLSKAKKEKNDEFYTQLTDIEKEMKHYKEHFKGKVVYCNCDDPRVSNFFHYFSYNFESLGLKKLIATCYKSESIEEYSTNDSEQAVCLVYEGDKDGNRIPDVEEIGVITLKGDGDFRSKESIALSKEADIVVTNPPFSLFREYVSQLMKYEKKFLIVGNHNAVTNKDMFPYIQENKMWLGQSPRSMNFKIPGGELKSVNACWFTNLETKNRYEDLILYEKYCPDKYPKYDNYNAIEVSKTKEIPKDYEGIMGVPITFLDKYNPDQFEILWQSSGNTRASTPSDILEKIGYTPHKEDRGGCAVLSGKRKYSRILIKNKKVVK